MIYRSGFVTLPRARLLKPRLGWGPRPALPRNPNNLEPAPVEYNLSNLHAITIKSIIPCEFRWLGRVGIMPE